MNNFTKNRILVGAVILLTTVNLAILGTIAFQRIKPHEPIPARESFRDRPNYGRTLANELDLTPEQSERFEQLRREHFEATTYNKRALQKHYRMVMEELSNEVPSRAKLDSLAHEIGKLHEEQQVSTIEHFIELREMCTPEQYQNLQHMFRRGMDRSPRMMNRERNNPMGRGKNRTNNE